MKLNLAQTAPAHKGIIPPLGWLLGGLLATLLGNVLTLVICAGIFIGFNLLAYLRSSQLREV